MSTRAAVLVVAGVDSSGGAGLARDLATTCELGVDAMCAVTAVTVQTDVEVLLVHPLSPEVVKAQIQAAMSTRRIHSVKVGMLATAPIVTAVVEALVGHEQVPVVVDPVVLASSGGTLLDDAGLRRLRELLLPRTALLTPNVPEAALLLGVPVAQCESDKLQQAQQLLDAGAQAVLLKGGHDSGAHALDLLMTRAGSVIRLSAPRVHARLRGTGCALSTAIAASLAGGLTLELACERAKEYVFSKLQARALEISG